MTDQQDSGSEVNFNINHPGWKDESPNIKSDPYTGEEDCDK
jgi:hypothetical protein